MKTIEEKAAELEQKYNAALAKLATAKERAEVLAKIDAAIEEQRKIRDVAEERIRVFKEQREEVSPKRPKKEREPAALKDPRITMPKRRNKQPRTVAAEG